MNQPGLTVNFEAGAAITKHRIVKFGSDDELAVQAAAATDALIGVSTEVDADSGDRVDVIVSGIAQVEFGGNVTRGGALTADSNGKAVAAAPSSGVNNRIIGWAAVSGASGDIGSVILAPGEIQGE